MRTILVGAVIASALSGLSGCAEGVLRGRAETALGSSSKHVTLEGHDHAGLDDVYTFCRHEHRTAGSPPFPGTRTYDAACIMFVCAKDEAPEQCNAVRM